MTSRQPDDMDDCPSTTDQCPSTTDRWVQGYACAVATLQRMDGSSMLTTKVKELMSIGSLTHRDCKAAGVDEYDIEALFPPKPKGEET